MAGYLTGEEMFLSDAAGLSSLFEITIDELACIDGAEFPRRGLYITKD